MTRPAEGTKERTAEKDAWAYHETEIYAALRSVPYHTVPTAADAPKVATPTAQALVTVHIGLMTQQWAPTIAIGLLRGLRQRLAVDPRITDAALQVFDAAVLQNSNAATQAVVAQGSPR